MMELPITTGANTYMVDPAELALILFENEGDDIDCDDEDAYAGALDDFITRPRAAGGLGGFYNPNRCADSFAAIREEYAYLLS